MQASEIDAFLIGFPKAGTTSMAGWLDDSESIRVSTPKETFAACPEFGENYRRAGSVSLDEAFEGDGDGLGRVLLLEATTLNVYSGSLRDELRRGRSRVIVLLRTHADLVESWHEQMLFAGDTSIESLDESWAFSLAHEEDETIDIKQRYSLMFRQGLWVERWVAALGHDRVLLVRNEELREAGSLGARLSAFLDVDLSGLGPLRRDNLRLRRSARWLRYLKAPALRGAFMAIDRNGAIERRVKARIRRYFASKDREPVDAGLHRSMDEHFAPDARLLEELVSRNREVHGVPCVPDGATVR